MQVTVDLKDLETIIYATAVITRIEHLLESYNRDPFVKPKQQFKDAHDNLVFAMNSATRVQAGTAVAWDGELTKDEIDFLKHLQHLFKGGTVWEANAEQRTGTSFPIDDLASKGCVKIGQGVRGAVWPGEARADLKPTHTFPVVITSRGLAKLEEALKPPQKELGLENKS